MEPDETVETTLQRLKDCDWDRIENDVVERLRMLRAVVQKTACNPITERIANDLFAPALRKLGEFCTMIRVEEEDGEEEDDDGDVQGEMT